MTEWLLQMIDALLGISPPQEAPAVMPDNQLSGNLVDYYKEIHGDMRALRETEQKSVALFYQVIAFLFAGHMVIVASASARITPEIRMLVAVFAIVLLVLFWLAVHGRIAYDHKSYAFLMTRKRQIELHWYGKEFSERPPHLGSKPAGPGYRKAQALLAVTAVFIGAAMAATALLSVPPLPWK